MDDIVECIAEIYDAVGDVERWQRISERLAAAGGLPAELARHVEIARQAHEQHLRVACEVEALERVHAQLALGAIVVDREGRLLRANAAGTQLLAGGQALAIVGGCVTAADAATHDALRAAVAQAVDTGAASTPGTSFVLVTRANRQPLTVVVQRAREPLLHFFEGRLPVLLLVIDPELSAELGTDVLRALFGFTRREAELARLLTQGLSLEETARTLGVSMNTARTFLAHVAAKTDSHSQAELVARLLAIPRVRAE